jgi:hypothetical protein
MWTRPNWIHSKPIGSALARDVLVSVGCFAVWRAPGFEKSHADPAGGSSTLGIAPPFVWKLTPALENSSCDRKSDRSYKRIPFLSTHRSVERIVPDRVP